MRVSSGKRCNVWLDRKRHSSSVLCFMSGCLYLWMHLWLCRILSLREGEGGCDVRFRQPHRTAPRDTARGWLLLFFRLQYMYPTFLPSQPHPVRPPLSRSLLPLCPVPCVWWLSLCLLSCLCLSFSLCVLLLFGWLSVNMFVSFSASLMRYVSLVFRLLSSCLSDCLGPLALSACLSICLVCGGGRILMLCVCVCVDAKQKQTVQEQGGRGLPGGIFQGLRGGAAGGHHEIHQVYGCQPHEPAGQHDGT